MKGEINYLFLQDKDEADNPKVFLPKTAIEAIFDKNGTGLGELLSQLSSNIIIRNLSITASDFKSDSTYTNYPYRITFTVEGIVNNQTIADVIFDEETATSGVFAPITNTVYTSGTSGTVYIYAKWIPSKMPSSITLRCMKEVSFR